MTKRRHFCFESARFRPNDDVIAHGRDQRPAPLLLCVRGEPQRQPDRDTRVGDRGALGPDRVKIDGLAPTRKPTGRVVPCALSRGVLDAVWKTQPMLEVRGAVAGDAMAIAGVHVRSWQEGYRGLLPDEYLNGLRAEDRASQYRFERSSADSPVTLVAIDDDALCGFATIGPAASSDEVNLGELLALYVDPSCWRLGVGRRLISEARQHMGDRGFAEAILWVLVGNARAAAFYAADGWTADGTRRQDEVWGVTADEARYRRALP